MVNSVANHRSFGVCETTEDSEVGSTIQKALFAFLRKCVCIKKLHRRSFSNNIRAFGCIQCKTGELINVYLINASRSIHCIVLYGLPLFFQFIHDSIYKFTPDLNYASCLLIWHDVSPNLGLKTPGFWSPQTPPSVNCSVVLCLQTPLFPLWKITAGHRLWFGRGVMWVFSKEYIHEKKKKCRISTLYTERARHFHGTFSILQSLHQCEAMRPHWVFEKQMTETPWGCGQLRKETMLHSGLMSIYIWR